MASSAGETFLKYCEYVTKGAGALEGAGRVINGLVLFVKSVLEDECYICGEKLKGKDMREHVVSKHSVEKCFICEEAVGRLGLREHVLEHRFIDCWVCKETVRVEDLRVHFTTHNESDETKVVEEFIRAAIATKCSECDKWVLVGEYSSHIKEHLNQQTEGESSESANKRQIEKKDQ